MFRLRTLLVTTLPFGAALLAACYAGAPDPVEVLAVGPAPLRRLSNSEYLNALHDLFPGQSPALPPLPADSIVAGFENATEAQKPSDVRIARYETIATLYAEWATTDSNAVRALAQCDWATPTDATTCAAKFIERTGARIFRRPLEQAERDRFAQRFSIWMTSIDFEAAVRLTLSAMLQSPQFLYRAEPPPASAKPGVVIPVEPYAMASRLSFFLWESSPDDVLLDAAARNELTTSEQIRDQATRMLADARAKRVFWDFHRQWLGLDRILGDEHLFRTSAIDPNWTSATPASVNKESELFIENVLMENGTLGDMFNSRRAWLDGEMARIYGVASPSDPDAWSEVSLPESERSGIFTRAAFLAGYSHRGGTSPPIRGNAVLLRALCQLPVSPPPGADLSMPIAAEGSGPQTNRMLFEARTKPAACAGCHLSLNGFGFGFENYNAAGAHQSIDNGLPIDASGVIRGTDVNRPFNGAIDLSDALSRSRVVHHCATQQWIRYALGRAPIDIELPTVETLTNRFVADGGNVKHLLLEIVTAPSFRLRRVEAR